MRKLQITLLAIILLNITNQGNTQALYYLPGISTLQESQNTDQTTTELTENANLQIKIDANTIHKNGARTVSEALQQLSLIQVYSQTGSSPIFYIHGLRAQVLLNGQPLSGFDSSAAMVNLIPIESIDHISVYLNSDSTNYNDGMLGGIINIVTKIKHTEVSITPTYPKYGQASASFSKDINANNHLGFLQSVSNSYGNRQHDNQQTAQSMLSHTYHYDTGQVETNFIYLSQNSQFPGGLTQTQYDDNPYQAAIGWEIYKERSLNLQTSWIQNFNDNKSVTSTFQYRQSNAKGYFPSFNSSFDQDYQSISMSPKFNLLYHNDLFNKSISIQSGIDYRYESFVNTASINNSYRQSLQTLTSIDETINLWQLSQGIRFGYIYDHGSFISYENQRPVIQPPQNESYYPLAYHMGLAYLFTPNIKSAIRFSHNYQIPFIDQSNLTPEQQSGFGLKPQTSDGITFTQLIKNIYTLPLSFTANIYAMWINNQIAYDPNQSSHSAFPGANVNLSPIFQYGGDFLTNFKIHQNFTLGSSITLNIAQFQSGKMANGNSIEGNNVPGIPQISFEIHSNFTFKQYYHWYFQTQYHDKSYADGDYENSDGKTPSYWLLNTAFDYHNIPWIITIRINNLLNKQYNQYITDINHQWSYYPANGINGALTVTYQFN